MDTTYKQVTIDVPEDRLAEFHAFFARFLAGPGRRRRGRHGHGHHGHGHGCAGRRGSEAGAEGFETSEPTPGEGPAADATTEV